MKNGERTVVSNYKVLLHIAQMKRNKFLFPLESVSICSELPFYIKPENLYGYHTSSMNK